MKLFTLLIVGASLGFGAGAVEVRRDERVSPFAHLRLGHAAAAGDQNRRSVVPIVGRPNLPPVADRLPAIQPHPAEDKPIVDLTQSPRTADLAHAIKGAPAQRFRHRPGCQGGMRGKITKVTHWIKYIFGFAKDKDANIVPVPIAKEEGVVVEVFTPPPQPQPAVVMGIAAIPMHPRNRSFLHRLHHAIMILGPWESRAVAFVFGAGVGVLLRMLYVFVVLAFRSFRARRQSVEEDDDEYIPVIVEEVYVAPPEYFPIDEKVAPPS